MLELTCGRGDGSWNTRRERKHFHVFFPSYASITIVVIFLIINRVNKQIVLQTNAGANMWYVGRIMDYGDRKETFSYIFSFLCFHYYRDGGNFSNN